MVAGLPQQVLLHLVLAIGVTTGRGSYTSTSTSEERSFRSSVSNEKNLKMSEADVNSSIMIYPNKYYRNILLRTTMSDRQLNELGELTEKPAIEIIQKDLLEDKHEEIKNKTDITNLRNNKSVSILEEEKLNPLNENSLQPISAEIHKTQKVSLSKLNSSRQIVISPWTVGEQVTKEISPKIPTEIRKYSGIHTKNINETVKPIENYLTPMNLKIQWNRRVTISVNDGMNSLLVNQLMMKGDVPMLHQQSDIYSAHSLRFRAISSSSHFNDNPMVLVPYSPISPTQYLDDDTTLPSVADGSIKRYMRDAPKNLCEKFEIGDINKQEFYSPNYPQNYPPQIDCIRVLEADKGMLIKLDFRDHFVLEASSPMKDNKERECRFDFLEVRDGQHGFSTPIGNYCDTNFPPEITSKSRYLWLRFHSDDTIEYKGFKAVWSMIPRPTYPGISPEPEPCIRNVTDKYEAIISSADVEEEKKIAEKSGLPLDCLWIVTVKDKWRMQLAFDTFKLDKPNDCDANFLSIFNERPEMPSILKHFCGSIAEAVFTKSHIMYIRFYLEPKAINSTFVSLMTAVRDRGTDASCNEDEYDCDDATCIAGFLRCNERENCRLKWDEDPSICGKEKGAIALDSTRIVIILVIFSLIMFGMCFAFVFNCVRKLVRDHRIIQEHIRQSRENRLDEIGRKATPCLITSASTDVRQRGSESSSLEIDSNKELIPSTMLTAHEYTEDLVLETNYGTTDINDIHQSNNVSNATQERLQESSEEPEMCDSSCQTRESLFDPGIVDPSVPSNFSTFAYQSRSHFCNGMNINTQKALQHQLSRQSPIQNSTHSSSNRQQSEPCSVCNSSFRRESSSGICPKHTAIPAPPGWSVHEQQYSPALSASTFMESDYPSYQSPKQEVYQQSSSVTPKKNDKYCSFYGSKCGSNATNTHNSSHCGSRKYSIAQVDPQYLAETVIEVDQKRPFSIESTKSAPDVIATH